MSMTLPFPPTFGFKTANGWRIAVSPLTQLHSQLLAIPAPHGVVLSRRYPRGKHTKDNFPIQKIQSSSEHRAEISWEMERFGKNYWKHSFPGAVRALGASWLQHPAGFPQSLGFWHQVFCATGTPNHSLLFKEHDKNVPDLFGGFGQKCWGFPARTAPSRPKQRPCHDDPKSSPRLKLIMYKCSSRMFPNLVFPCASLRSPLLTLVTPALCSAFTDEHRTQTQALGTEWSPTTARAMVRRRWGGDHWAVLSSGVSLRALPNWGISLCSTGDITLHVLGSILLMGNTKMSSIVSVKGL